MTDSSLCPICGQPNACAMATGTDHETQCWCVTADFPPVLPEQLPESACICARCARELADQQPDRSDDK